MSGRRGLGMLAALVAWATPAAAMAVACSVQSVPVTFGTYNPVSPIPATATGSIDVGCTCQILLDCIAFAYRIEIGAGQSGSATMRQMKAGSETLNYALYQDSAYTVGWGSGATGRSANYMLNLFGTYQRSPVYGRAPAGQTVRPGTFTDMPIITIVY